MKTLYFAYGSNMLDVRMHARVFSAELLGPAFLKNMRMSFNKRGKDGSGKANLVESSGDITWGVLYEIDAKDLEKLDRAEGGYERVAVSAWQPDGIVVDAVTYISVTLTDDPRPYKWYKDIVLSGAKKNGFPEDYIANINRFPSKSQ